MHFSSASKQLYIHKYIVNAHHVVPESSRHKSVSFLTKMKTVWREIGTVRPSILKIEREREREMMA